ncbi:MAG TPA: Holliday junction resolvase RuvX [Candidatus Paceibacterota bacterium]|nr:Holliday junction resolvase RuvX [Candidatus Paceibacterota bacterium]
MKFLGVDYGEKRVGIAISDEAGEFAFPRAVVSRQKAVQEIAALAAEEQVAGIIIGDSVASNEEANQILEKVKQFAAALEKVVPLPIKFEREDYSSVEAHRYQTKAGAKDDSAAAIILQRFLDKKRGIYS